MIDKKVLILTAAMLPMLGLADVGAMPSNTDTNQSAEQHLQNFKTTSKDAIYSEYDVQNQTIRIKGVKYKLNDPVPQEMSSQYPGLKLKYYLCLRSPSKSLQVEHLGVFDDLPINEELPPEWTRCKNHSNFRYTWGEFLCISRPSLAKRFNLYNTDFLSKRLPSYYCMQFKLPENSPFGLAIRLIDLIVFNISLPDGFLDQKVPDQMTYRKRLCDPKQSCKGMTFREYICFYFPYYAHSLNLYTPQFSKTLLSDAVLVNNFHLYGTTWGDYYKKRLEIDGEIELKYLQEYIQEQKDFFEIE